MNEYHPEYHPVTTTTLIQNVSSPTTTVNENEGRVDPQPPIEPKTALIVGAILASALPAKVDPPLPSQAPGTYLGPNVQIGSGVTFNGNVYVQGNLIIGGTREHPVLTTTQ